MEGIMGLLAETQTVFARRTIAARKTRSE